MKKLRLARDGYLAVSILFCAAGLCYILLPEPSPSTVCTLSGVILLLYGIIKITGYFSNDLYCLAFQYDLACGLFLVVLGVILLSCRQRVLPYLSPGLGVLVLLDSLLAIQTAKDARQFGLRTWSVILAAAMLAAAFSVLLIVRPYHSPLAAHLAAGGTLLAEGLKNLCVVVFTVKTMQRRSPESGQYPT